MNSLVQIQHGRPFTNTLAIAEGVGMAHASVIKLVRKHRALFEELGTFGFEIQKSGGRNTEFALLSEDQATFLMTLFKNSETVLTFKLRLVKAFRAALREIERLAGQRRNPEWQLIRDETKVGNGWMNLTLEEKRRLAGKKTAFYHYANEARLINSVMTGNFAGLDRDRLSASDLHLIGELQRYNTVLIAQDLPYAERKTRLHAHVVRMLPHLTPEIAHEHRTDSRQQSV